MKPYENQSLERILESAILVSWADLMRGAQTGLIHIEYGFAAGGTLDYLQVWSSVTRGHWLLACGYWMSASRFHGTGVHFDNKYQSEGLGAHSGICDATPNRICASPRPWQAGVAPDSNAHRRREHGRGGVGERSLRPFRLSARPACAGVNSGRSRARCTASRGLQAPRWSWM